MQLTESVFLRSHPLGLAGCVMCADPPLDRGSHHGYWCHRAPAGDCSVCAVRGLVACTHSALCPIIFVFALSASVMAFKGLRGGGTETEYDICHRRNVMHLQEGAFVRKCMDSPSSALQFCPRPCKPMVIRLQLGKQVQRGHATSRRSPSPPVSSLSRDSSHPRPPLPSSDAASAPPSPACVGHRKRGTRGRAAHR